MPSQASWTAVLLIGAVRGGEEPRASRAPGPVPRLVQRAPAALLLLEASRSAVVSISRGPAPPLRNILGQREEAALVDEAPPGTLSLALRACTLFLIFLPVLLSAPLAFLLRPFRHSVFFELLTWALARAGTAFIKWGQWASCRPDMFPERLCASLSRLHSQAPTHGFRHTRALVEAATGEALGDYFDEFERRPFASGSIAQIHRATLRGKPVAVKVRHPHVTTRIVSDFLLMRGTAKFAPSWLNLKGSVEQFSSTMVAQTRLDIEAEHLRRFGWNFAGWRDCRFPRVVLADKAVLIESLEAGELVSKYTLQQQLRMSGQEGRLSKRVSHFVVSRGEDIYLKMLLVDNLMHADLHPGNILLQLPGGSQGALRPTCADATASRPRQPRSPSLVLLDLGMVARLTPEESSAFIGFLQAVGAGDGAAAARCVLRFSERQLCGAAEAEAFCSEMSALFLQSCRGFGSDVKFGEVLRGVLGLVRRHRVAIDANYMTLVTNVLCLEGMAATLLPEYNVLDAARPLLLARRWLPGPLFKAALPAVARLQQLRHSVRSLLLRPRE